MARVSIVLGTSHSPFLYATPDEWEEARARRAALGAVNADVPIDSPEENQAKYRRIQAAFSVLKQKLTEAQPDVLLIFGDDQGEQFSFANFPAFNIFAGDSFAGYKVSRSVGLPATGVKRSVRPKDAEHWTTVQGCPELARYLLESLMEREFDVAFSLQLASEENGMGHAFMRPSFYLRPDYDVPTIPFSVNCYYAPQPTGRRCYALGRAVREAIDAWPQDLNVAVIGSGGLWHTPGAPNAWLNEAFDQQTLAAVRSGDAREMASHFDGARGAASSERAVREAETGGTFMRGGVGSGTGETRNWVVAAAIADGSPGTVVDYVPVYASPCGMAFAYWDKP